MRVLLTVVCFVVAAHAISRTDILRQRVHDMHVATNGPVHTEEELARMSHPELMRLILAAQGSQERFSAVFWWNFTDADCGYDDVPGSCQGQTVDGCKATCIATTGCGGFNYPHGVLKQTNCLSNKAYDGTVDLYVIQSAPQPPPPPPASNYPPIWPFPASFSSGTTSAAVAPGANFLFAATTPSADLSNAFVRFANLFFPHTTTAPVTGGITGVTVSVANVSADLQLGVDESYTLTVPAAGPATITAATNFGAYHALQTLSQLIAFDFDTQTYVVALAPWTVSDAPRFAHREVLVDTSRHFQPLWTLQNFIESLPYAKINTVHWHLVDSQSFPFMSPSALPLSQGAWSSQERYTVADVAQVVEFARQRGVRIMVEIDTPGHAGSWCSGYPDICPSATCLEPLNPSTNATFDVIAALFNDLTGGARGLGLFPDNLLHLGGDEVNTNCWTSTPAIAAWLQANGLTADGGYAYFVKRVQAIAHGFGRDVVNWEEVWDHFGTALDKSTIIHQWLPGSTIAANATSHGYRVLWSTDGVWYLDGLGTTWQTMYQQEPCNGIPDAQCDAFIEGGGGEMWGETVDTSDLQQTVWPRLGAIAERLWSPRNITSAADAAVRFSAFRCLLNQRGVAAAPSNNPAARTAPNGPGSCYAQ